MTPPNTEQSEFKTSIEERILSIRAMANTVGSSEMWTKLNDGAITLEKIRDLANDKANIQHKSRIYNAEEIERRKAFIEGAEWFQSKIKNLL